METIEELEKRRRELELRRDIARLERQRRISAGVDAIFRWIRRSPRADRNVPEEVRKAQTSVLEAPPISHETHELTELPSSDASYSQAQDFLQQYGLAAVEAFERAHQDFGDVVPTSQIAMSIAAKFGKRSS